MRSHFSKIHVRYVETDQMGVVYHGNYAQYLELARMEWLEEFGLLYKAMEERGLILPVYKMSINYKKPAVFGDEIEVETILRKRPTARITFDYIVRNKSAQILVEASTVLVFIDQKSNRPIKCPNYILEALGFS